VGRSLVEGFGLGHLKYGPIGWVFAVPRKFLRTAMILFCRAPYNKTHDKHFCIIKIFVIAFDILKLSNDFKIFI
jgi:hypothetical protein